MDLWLRNLIRNVGERIPWEAVCLTITIALILIGSSIVAGVGDDDRLHDSPCGRADGHIYDGL